MHWVPTAEPGYLSKIGQSPAEVVALGTLWIGDFDQRSPLITAFLLSLGSAGTHSYVVCCLIKVLSLAEITQGFFDF